MNDFSIRLKKAIEENGMKAIDLSKKTGISRSSISEWLSGKYEAKQDKVFVLAKALNVDPSWLLGLDVPMRPNKDILDIYNDLEKKRQENVYHYAEEQLEEQNNIVHLDDYIEETQTDGHHIALHGRLSAGTGAINYNRESPQTIAYYGEVPKHDLCFVVQGDSMTPLFKDNEILFIEKTYDIRSGQVIAVSINGEEFVKKAYKEEKQLRLVSLNKKYEDITANEFDDIRVIGRVIL